MRGFFYGGFLFQLQVLQLEFGLSGAVVATRPNSSMAALKPVHVRKNATTQRHFGPSALSKHLSEAFKPSKSQAAACESARERKKSKRAETKQPDSVVHSMAPKPAHRMAPKSVLTTSPNVSLAEIGDDDDAECIDVSGAYSNLKSHPKPVIEVLQDGCNVAVNVHGVPHLGRVHGHTVRLPSFSTTGAVHQNGDIVWGFERHWSRLAKPNELRCDEADVDGQPLSLTPDEFRLAQCPRGKYLSIRSPQDQQARSQRLRKALCVSKAAGKVQNNPYEEDTSRQRGYMTYESSLWPKRQECTDVLNITSANEKSIAFRLDSVPQMARLVRRKEKLEFRKVWKAASTTLPRYLQCEWGSQWEQVPATEPQHKDFRVVAAVREPIDRWVSGVGEIFARLLNGWCINAPCDDLDDSKMDRLRLGTTWHHTLNISGGSRYDPSKVTQLISHMVHDTACNYRFYASDHLISQSTFLSQNAGRGAYFRLIMKLEELASGLDELNRLAPAPEPNGACEVVPDNVAECKPSGHTLPSSTEIKELLQRHPALMRELCLTYAQDFICFDYELPRACKGLF